MQERNAELERALQDLAEAVTKIETLERVKVQFTFVKQKPSKAVEH